MNSKEFNYVILPTLSSRLLIMHAKQNLSLRAAETFVMYDKKIRKFKYIRDK